MAKSVSKGSAFAGMMSDIVPKHVHADTHTHDDANVAVETSYAPQKELKQRRIQVLTYDSLVTRMDEFCRSRGISRAELIERSVSEYMDAHK